MANEATRHKPELIDISELRAIVFAVLCSLDLLRELNPGYCKTLNSHIEQLEKAWSKIFDRDAGITNDKSSRRFLP